MQIILLANKVGWGVQSLGRVVQDQLNNEGHSVQTLYFEDVLTHAGCAHLEDLRKLYSSDILLGRENRVNQFIRSINEIDQTALDRLEQILDQNELEAYAELGTERQAQNAALRITERRLIRHGATQERADKFLIKMMHDTLKPDGGFND